MSPHNPLVSRSDLLRSCEIQSIFNPTFPKIKLPKIPFFGCKWGKAKIRVSRGLRLLLLKAADVRGKEMKKDFRKRRKEGPFRGRQDCVRWLWVWWWLVVDDSFDGVDLSPSLGFRAGGFHQQQLRLKAERYVFLPCRRVHYLSYLSIHCCRSECHKLDKNKTLGGQSAPPISTTRKGTNHSSEVMKNSAYRKSKGKNTSITMVEESIKRLSNGKKRYCNYENQCCVEMHIKLKLSYFNRSFYGRYNTIRSIYLNLVIPSAMGFGTMLCMVEKLIGLRALPANYPISIYLFIGVNIPMDLSHTQLPYLGKEKIEGMSTMWCKLYMQFLCIICVDKSYPCYNLFWDGKNIIMKWDSKNCHITLKMEILKAIREMFLSHRKYDCNISKIYRCNPNHTKGFNQTTRKGSTTSSEGTNNGSPHKSKGKVKLNTVGDKLQTVVSGTDMKFDYPCNYSLFDNVIGKFVNFKGIWKKISFDNYIAFACYWTYVPSYLLTANGCCLVILHLACFYGKINLSWNISCVNFLLILFRLLIRPSEIIYNKWLGADAMSTSQLSTTNVGLSKCLKGQYFCFSMNCSARGRKVKANRNKFCSCVEQISVMACINLHCMFYVNQVVIFYGKALLCWKISCWVKNHCNYKRNNIQVYYQCNNHTGCRNKVDERNDWVKKNLLPMRASKKENNNFHFNPVFRRLCKQKRYRFVLVCKTKEDNLLAYSWDSFFSQQEKDKDKGNMTDNKKKTTWLHAFFICKSDFCSLCVCIHFRCNSSVLHVRSLLTNIFFYCEWIWGTHWLVKGIKVLLDVTGKEKWRTGCYRTEGAGKLLISNNFSRMHKSGAIPLHYQLSAWGYSERLQRPREGSMINHRFKNLTSKIKVHGNISLKGNINYCQMFA